MKRRVKNMLSQMTKVLMIIIFQHVQFFILFENLKYIITNANSVLNKLVLYFYLNRDQVAYNYGFINYDSKNS